MLSSRLGAVGGGGGAGSEAAAKAALGAGLLENLGRPGPAGLAHIGCWDTAVGWHLLLLQGQESRVPCCWLGQLGASRAVGS